VAVTQDNSADLTASCCQKWETFILPLPPDYLTQAAVLKLLCFNPSAQEKKLCTKLANCLSKGFSSWLGGEVWVGKGAEGWSYTRWQCQPKPRPWLWGCEPVSIPESEWSKICF